MEQETYDKATEVLGEINTLNTPSDEIQDILDTGIEGFDYGEGEDKVKIKIEDSNTIIDLDVSPSIATSLIKAIQTQLKKELKSLDKQFKDL